MAFDSQPDTWIDDWSEDATDISVPIASFPKLTAEEADGVTGDVRKLFFAIADEMFTAFDSKATADKPNRMTLSRKAVVVDEIMTWIYTFKFECNVSDADVATEE